MFWLAGQEGLLSNASASPSLHAGLRTRLSGDTWEDHEDDAAQNWVRISADDIDDIGTAGVIKAIMDTFATAESEDDPVYLSVDIDVLDPGTFFFGFAWEEIMLCRRLGAVSSSFFLPFPPLPASPCIKLR